MTWCMTWCMVNFASKLSFCQIWLFSTRISIPGIRSLSSLNPITSQLYFFSSRLPPIWSWWWWVFRIYFRSILLLSIKSIIGRFAWVNYTSRLIIFINYYITIIILKTFNNFYFHLFSIKNIPSSPNKFLKKYLIYLYSRYFYLLS